MGVLENKIQQTINKLMAPGLKLHIALCFLYGSVTSECDFQQFVNYVSDLVQLSVCSSQLSDIRTAELQSLEVELISKSRFTTAKITSMSISADHS